MDVALEFIPNLLSEKLHKDLTAIPSALEVKEAVFSFEGNKAPGLGGFPFLFFNHVGIFSLRT